LCFLIQQYSRIHERTKENLLVIPFNLGRVMQSSAHLMKYQFVGAYIIVMISLTKIPLSNSSSNYSKLKLKIEVGQIFVIWLYWMNPIASLMLCFATGVSEEGRKVVRSNVSTRANFLFRARIFILLVNVFFTKRIIQFFSLHFFELLSYMASSFMVWRNYTTVFPYNIIIVLLKIWLIINLLLKYSTNQELIFMFSDNAGLLFPNRCIPEEFFKEQKKKNVARILIAFRVISIWK